MADHADALPQIRAAAQAVEVLTAMMERPTPVSAAYARGLRMAEDLITRDTEPEPEPEGQTTDEAQPRVPTLTPISVHHAEAIGGHVVAVSRDWRQIAIYHGRGHWRLSVGMDTTDRLAAAGWSAYSLTP